jgi:hypothetical protein
LKITSAGCRRRCLVYLKCIGVNENLATATIEGALTMAGDSVDLDGVRNATAESGVDILLARHGIRRATWAVSKKWWHSFGNDYVLAAIQASREKVLAYLVFLF